MASTTQYYSLETYEDGDSPDLTAQYNESMVKIDNAMHDLNARLETVFDVRHNYKFAFLGDSWTDPSVVAYDWVSMFGRVLGVETINYAVSGATLAASNNSMLAQALRLTNDNVSNLGGVIIVGGVNDAQTESALDSYSVITSVNNICKEIVGTYGNVPIYWFLNAASWGTDAEVQESIHWAFNKYKNGMALLPYHVYLNCIGNAFLPLVVAIGRGYSDDYIHPNVEGDQQIAYYIASTVSGAACSRTWKSDEFSIGFDKYATYLSVTTPNTTIVDANKNVSVLRAFARSLTQSSSDPAPVASDVISANAVEQAFILPATPPRFNIESS